MTARRTAARTRRRGRSRSRSTAGPGRPAAGCTWARSALMDGGSLEFAAGNDEPYICYLPTYAAIAHYHGKHGDRPLREVLDEAESYAARDYRWALAQGARLTADERAEAVRRIAALTGPAEDYGYRVT